MFRLITEEQKIKIRKLYSGRFFVYFLLLLFLLLLSYLVSIFPRYISLRSEVLNIRKQVEQAQGAELSTLRNELNNLSKDVYRKTQKLPDDRVLPSVIIDEITSSQNPGIGFDNIEISYLENNNTVVITGVASNRDSLRSFISNLENGGLFGTTTLPVSQLVLSSDIPFSLTFPLKK